MGLNRRNVLIGLGTIVGGGGVLVGTGAFSTVSASRSVSVQTAGDGSAFLTIEGDDEYVTDDSNGGTLAINLTGSEGSGFNQEAITTITDVVTITNNAADGSSTTVGVSNESPASADANGSTSLLITENQDGSGDNVAVVTFYVGDEGTNSINNGSTVELSTGSKAQLDVEIDTTSSTLESTSAPTGGLTIVAE